MAQKSNLISIRNPYSFNLVSYNSKNWVSLYNFMLNFTRLVNIKGILTQNFVCNMDNNIVYIFIYFFYQNSKISFYRNRCIKANILTKFFKKNFLLKKIFHVYTSQLRISKLFLKINVLNRMVNKLHLSHFRFFLKNYHALFIRRFNLFIDFIKVVVLFVNKVLDTKVFIFFLSRLFKFLSKRSHTKFLSFVKDLFFSILNFESNSKIGGFKFVVNGKIRGKDRASTKLIQLGKVPAQSISKNIDFCFSHVYTIYGAFGFKLWVYSKNF